MHLGRDRIALSSSSAAVEPAELHTYLRAGDLRGAGAWLVERHAHEVLGLCRAMVHDATTAEDLAQDVFGRAFAGLSGYRGDASPRTWLLAIARNRCIDHLRAEQRDPWRGAPPESAGDPDEQPDERPLPPDLLARRDQVASALTQLGEGERALVLLRFRHGLEYSELADIFGLREGTVRMRLSRALARMRRALQPTLLDVAAARAEDAASMAGASAARRRAADSVAAPSLLDRLLGRRPASPARREPHPLVAVLGLLDPGVPRAFREQLLEVAREL
jgi:RNA polymerase sigma-70 factor (ECF subfamily)